MGTSLTAKLNRKRLQETLRRRKAARTITYLLDRSVPSELRFHGILAEGVQRGKPSVHIAAGHDLSPYIVHLNAHLPQPMDLMGDGRSALAPNLLLPEKYFLTVEDASRMNPGDDLLLTREDILGQAEEDMAQWKRAVVANRIAPSVSDPVAYEHPSALRAQFVPDAFTPPKAPENFAAYFEMPEADEADLAEEPDEITINFRPAFSEIAAEPSVAETGAFVPANEDEPADERIPWTIPTFQILPVGWHRALGGFVLASILFVLPIHALNLVSSLRQSKSGLEDASRVALSQLQAGASAVLVRDASAASSSFDRAGSAFSRARQSVSDLGSATSLLLSAIPATGKTYRTGTKLLEAGQSLSSAGERIAQGVLAAQGELSPTPTSRLKILSTYVSSAQPELLSAARLIASIRAEDVPPERRETFVTLSESLPKLVTSVGEFLSFSEMAETILGGNGAKRYLVVFQNNNEIRATGGFMGSFAELRMNNGEISKMEIPGGGTYDLQGSLRTNVVAPAPLSLLSARWEFQDANWFPDFPTTARQIMQFYEDAGGGTVDGVIAVNATYVQDFLTLLGPIDMPEYGRTISSENLISETQKIVETEYDRTENKPKAFIGDLAPKLVERVMDGSSQDFFAVIDRVDAGLRSRDLQVYFADGELERKVRDLGWGGEVRQTTSDYLMLVNTNLGGGKTDGVISETAEVTVSIGEDGSIVDTVTVTRTHDGARGEDFSGVNNVNYVRLYVPKGATLLSAGGFTIPDRSLFEEPLDDWQIDDDLLYQMESRREDPASQTDVYEEFGKTVFGNWVQTKPGESSTYSFAYRLPFSLQTDLDDSLSAVAMRAVGMPTTEPYSFTLQKQSGILNRTTSVSIRVPSALRVSWQSQDLSSSTFGNASDAFIGALFEPIQ